MRANLTKLTSPLNSTPRRFSTYHLSTLLLHFLFDFSLPRCTLPDIPSVSSLASSPFLPCCHRAATTTSGICPFAKYNRRNVHNTFTRNKNNRALVLFFVNNNRFFEDAKKNFPQEKLGDVFSISVDAFFENDKVVDRKDKMNKI